MKVKLTSTWPIWRLYRLSGYLLLQEVARFSTGNRLFYHQNHITMGRKTKSYVTSSPPMVGLQSLFIIPNTFFFKHILYYLGILNWELPVVQRPLKLCMEASESDDILNSSSTALGYRKEDLEYRWFARLLLEGNVFSELQEFKQHFKLPPSSITARKANPKVWMTTLDTSFILFGRLIQNYGID